MSTQTADVLRVLSREPSDWKYGYAVAKATGLASGTLYPILIRLADRHLLEAKWEEDVPTSRPRRHLYRLTDAGLELAAAADRVATIPDQQLASAHADRRESELLPRPASP